MNNLGHNFVSVVTSPLLKKWTSERIEIRVSASADCFSCRLLSGGQSSTSGSVQILYTSRQKSWAGKALGTPENFPALLYLVARGKVTQAAGC